MNTTNNVRDNLLKVARQEFFEYGYKGVSMRDISQKTNMALGNIYYYFKSKDELFITILKDTLDGIREVMNHHNQGANISMDVFVGDTKNYKFIWHFTEVVIKYRKELYLLFEQSQGSAMENYPDKLVNELTEMGITYLNRMKDKYPHLNITITHTFMRLQAFCQVFMIRELVRNHEIPDKEFERFVREYALYNSSGWKEILGV